ncbi:MAG: efflux RND transporter periplasmic adaptor subunit [Opitutales bacterium]|jgi:HlyD family secretion protein
MKRYPIILISLVVLIAAGAGYWYYSHREKAASLYDTTPVVKGNVQVTITATGTVEPLDSVDVGAQVAGLIVSFGQDPHDPTKTVDYDTQVENGTVLANIDPSLYQSAVDQNEALYDQAVANLGVAKANLDQYQAKLVDAKNDWDRAQKIGPSEALAKTEYDGYQATYETAKANVALGQASIIQAQAQIEAATANLDQAKVNLSYCVIKSPVKGVIVDRRVNIGQTVVSSLSAPSLFLIATDLSKIQIWVSVNEADVGRLHTGMPVTFDVDAFPDREFQGTVGKIRLNATMTQNVVVYTVEVNADNPDMVLLPYFTANVKFLVDERDNVLLVPNASLRWRPADAEEPESAASPASAASNTTSASTGGGQGQHNGKHGGHGGQNRPAKQGTVWVLDSDGKPKPVSVRIGITDGVSTEVISGLQENQEVIVGENSSDSDGGGGTTNPFAPQFFRRR